MTDGERIEARLRALRSDPNAGQSALRALIIDQEWLWRKLGLLLGFAMALVVTVLTLTPMPAGTVLTHGVDKVYHVVGFALVIFPLIVTDSRRWPWAVPLVMALGGAIELIQPSVGRSAEWLDFGADVTGVLAGAALAELLHDRIRKSVFDADVRAPEPQQDLAEEQRIDAMRAELMAELRIVLREELAAAPRDSLANRAETVAPQADPPVGPSPAEEAAQPVAADTPARLRVVRH